MTANLPYGPPMNIIRLFSDLFVSDAMLLVQYMIGDLGFRKWRDCTICVAETKVLISCAVTMQLIWAFGFAYTKCRFSHGSAHIVKVFHSVVTEA